MIAKSKIKVFFVLLILILVSGFYVLPTKAAKVSFFSDILTDNGVNSLSNHHLRFITPSGINPGETIVLIFDSHFDINSVDYTDIDLLDDGVNLNLDSSASGATWGASFSGNTLTFTSGNGSITPGSLVEIKIGLNSSYQSIGDRQIRNPATSGSFLISLGGTMADRGELAVAIFDNTIGVTARVSSPGSGDIIPPIISNVQVINITTNSATVTWQTNEAATSTVKYGLLISYEIGDETIIEYVFFHSVNLTNLTPGTLYHFQVVSIDSYGNMAISDDYTFVTLPLVSEEECVINCGSLMYDLYIINPDGSERHMFTDYSRIDMVDVDVWRINFDDAGDDWDYNDLVMEVDKSDCENIKIKRLSLDAAWHHQIRIKFTNGPLSEDILLWTDSHLAGELIINIFDYPNLCLEVEELAKVKLRVLPEKRLPPVGNNGTLLWVRIMRGGTQPVMFNAQVWTDANGYSESLPLNNLPAGNYDFLLKGYSHLTYRKNSVPLNSFLTLIDFSEGGIKYVKAGDVNGQVGDNYVNGLDLSILGNNIYKDDYRSDLNQDKIVNGLEFSIAITNLYHWGDF